MTLKKLSTNGDGDLDGRLAGKRFPSVDRDLHIARLISIAKQRRPSCSAEISVVP